MILEVIAIDLEDIKLINQSNADRIEFCIELEKGGLTPSRELITSVLKESKLPVNIMVRPTDRDFCYTDEEWSKMLQDIKFLASTSVNAIVIGVLDKNLKIDELRMKRVIEMAGNKKITFNRAFDQTPDLFEALKTLENLGVSTILTSGGGKIDSTLNILNKLKNTTNKIDILAGGGVNMNNVVNIANNASEIHVGSAIRVNNTFSAPVDIKLINEMKEKIKSI